ncbi:uncharacterized protein LOC127279521 [Leptopilina boulardi]|uniref:uncharacterized protein LOC127279521 n=1 Tax=Leptopilina boulardi TaxID=63433 RepID=UPI0021F6516B|nr:uncharacterized protein LOC127279521 [Leptopilina boulardi]
MSTEEIKLLETACHSGDENSVRDILSRINFTNYFESYEAYLLLCNVLLTSICSLINFKKEDISTTIKFIKISELLVQHGVKVNVHHCLEQKYSPLHIAVLGGSEKMVKKLLLREADVNEGDILTSMVFTFQKYFKRIAKQLLKNGADLNNCDVCGSETDTPLYFAVTTEDIEMTEILLENVTVNERNHDRDTELHHSNLKEYKSISQLFLASPDNPDNPKNSANCNESEHPEVSEEQTVTPLHIAVILKNKKIVEILLSKGATVNTSNNEGYTPLHFAVMKNYIDIAQLLLDNGADIDIQNNINRKPFYYSKDPCMSSLYSLYKIKIYLNNGGNIEDKDDNCYTLLHLAIKYNLKDVVLFLLEKESNINAVSKLGETPLHLAAKERNKEITLLLLEKGLNVNATTNTGCTPLHLAADYELPFPFDQKDDFLKILLQNGANITVKNNFGMIPLNYAVRRHCTLDVKSLLGEEPDVNDKDLKMAFCLSFVNHYNKYDFCSGKQGCNDRCVSEIFVDFGFTIFIEDLKDMFLPEELYSSWLKKSTDKKFRSFVKKLLQKPKTSNIEELKKSFIEFEVLLGAVRHGFSDIVHNLLTPNISVNCQLQDGYTLLHFACKAKNLTVVEQLLQCGADINAMDKHQMSPLHISIKEFSVDVTRFLMKSADIEARDKFGETPLFLAIEEDNMKSIRLLLEAGANVNSINDYNEYPLYKAMRYGDVNVAKILLHYGAFVNACNTFKIGSVFNALDEFDDDCDKRVLEIVDLVFNYGAKVVDLTPEIFIVDQSHCARYQVKSIAANLENFHISVNSTEIADFQSQCLEEIQRMKSLKITGFNISIYDLLIKPHRAIGMYMRNKTVVDLLDAINFEEKFPLYAGKLKVCVMRGKLECRLLELAYHCLEVLKVKLPDVVVSEIVSYFDTSDLHRLIIASPISIDNKKSVQYWDVRYCEALSVENIFESEKSKSTGPLWKINGFSSSSISIGRIWRKASSRISTSTLSATSGSTSGAGSRTVFTSFISSVSSRLKTKANFSVRETGACGPGTERSSEPGTLFISQSPKARSIKEQISITFTVSSSLSEFLTGFLERASALQLILPGFSIPINTFGLYKTNTYGKMSTEEIKLLETACHSGDENSVRDILSRINFTNYFESYEAYLLLCNVLVTSICSSVNSNKENTSTTIKFIMISEVLVQHGVNVNIHHCLEHTFTPLYIAVLGGTEKIVKKLLLKGADVNKEESDILTPSMFIFLKHFKNIAQLLIKNGADPGNFDVCGSETDTPLHFAVTTEDIEMIEILLQNVTVNERNHDRDTELQNSNLKEHKSISQLFLASPDNPDNPKNSINCKKSEHSDFSEEQTVTPLHIAVLLENKKIVEILLSKGVAVNIANNEGYTPLHFAVMKNSIDIAQLLLDNGADIDIQNDINRKPFYYSQDLCMASLYSLHKIKIYLNNGGNIEDKDDNCYTLLHQAIKYNLKDVVLFLLDKESNINAVSKLGETPLHLAAKERNKEITLLLLEKGLNVNATTNTGCTPLHLAADYELPFPFDQKDDFLKILLQNGANITVKNNFGLMPLNYAVRRHCTLNVKSLLGEEPDVNDKDLKMAFCLSFFNHYNRIDNCSGKYGVNSRCVSEIFVDFGFTVYIEDFKDMFIPEELYSSWLKKSTDKKFRSFVKKLLQKPKTSNIEELKKSFIEFEVLLGAVRHGFSDIVHNLLTPNISVNCQLQDGYTLLHFACKAENLTNVKQLLRLGADINAMDENQMSPLYISIKEFSVDVTRFLMKSADIEARDKFGETPLFLAIEEDNMKSIRLLLEAGANVNSINDYNEYPLYKAMRYGDVNVAKILLHYGAFVNACNTFKIGSVFNALDEFDDDCDKRVLEIVDLVFNYGAKVVDLTPEIFIVDQSHCARYQVKSIAANLENFHISVNSTEIADFQSQCLEEIQRMKSLKITGFNISIYDLLIKPHRAIGMYMRNKTVVDLLDAINFEEKFPLYAGKLKVCVMRGKLECRLLELAYHCLEVLKVKLPDVVVFEIVSYFDTSDLHRLIIASPISIEKKMSVQYKENIAFFE